MGNLLLNYPKLYGNSANEIDLARNLLQSAWDEAPNRWLSTRQVAKLAALKRREVEKSLELLRRADLVDHLGGRWLFPSH
jgi:hypothetical protein